MATTLKFLPGSTIRWRATRFIVVDYADIDAIIARELGKRKLERIPVRDAKPDRTPGEQKAWTPDLVSIPAEAWKRAVTRFQVLKPPGGNATVTFIISSTPNCVISQVALV